MKPFQKNKLAILNAGCEKLPKNMNAKIALPILFIAYIVSSSAQSDRESVGIGAPGGFPPPSAAETEKYQQGVAAMMARMEQQQKTQMAGSQPFRVVDGKIYNVINSPNWEPVSGVVKEKSGGIVILENDLGNQTFWMAITNYSGDVLADLTLSTIAIRAGTYDMYGSPIALYDCGTLPTPEQWKQIKDDEAKAQAVIEQQQAAAQKAAQTKAYALQANVVRWLLPQATNGDASAQCDLGEHYLNGQGCETNLEHAIYWLQKSAAQGNIEASNKLASLNK